MTDGLTSHTLPSSLIEPTPQQAVPLDLIIGVVVAVVLIALIIAIIAAILICCFCFGVKGCNLGLFDLVV